MLKVAPILIFILTFFYSNLQAQDDQIDSLNKVLRGSSEDTIKVNTLIALSKKYFNSAPDEAIKYATQGKVLSEKIGFKKGKAVSLKNIGIGYYMQGKYIETFDFWNQSMAAFNEIGDKQGVANILSNLGSIYFDQGDDTKALEYYLKSLKISEEIGDKFRIATALGNVGNVYRNKKATYDKALAYYLRALPLSEEVKDNNIIGSTLVGIGEIYFEKASYDSALYYYNRSLIAYDGTEAVPYSLNDIGKVYTSYPGNWI
jgi:adenylate cyclase